MELKDKIYDLRKKYKLTYEQIALSVGVGKSTVRKWETGAILNIREDKLEKLALALHTTVDYLKGNPSATFKDSDADFGFYKIAAASPVIKVGNPDFNIKEIEKAVDDAVLNGAQILLTPELSLCGATCGDLFRQKTLLSACSTALQELLEYTAGIDMLIVVGMPVEQGFRLFNCAVALYKGRVVGVVPKEHIGDEQARWFSAFSTTGETGITVGDFEVPFGRLLFKLTDELTVGIEIGKDLWAAIPPSSFMALNSANLILNLSAEDEGASKAEYREELIKNQSARCLCAYAYAGSGVYESTTDAVYSGATIVAENGGILASGKRFLRENIVTYACVDVQKINALRCTNKVFAENALLHKTEYEIVNAPIGKLDLNHFDKKIDAHPFVSSDSKQRQIRCEEIFAIQSAGLAKRLEHTGLQKSVIGISGGLDSTLALLVAVRAAKLLGVGNENVIGITMPGFGTTDRTYNNALKLMELLGITVREISIKEACITHLNDIGHDINVHDVTYENAQARERTQILMDVANKEGGILVGTGDLSEIAMGWCTYNADHMSMYGVNAGIPKTLVRYMVEFVAGQSDKNVAAVLYDILDTPVSPELLPPDEAGNIAQKTEDKIGPYELHDFFLYHFVRFGFKKDKIAFMASQAFMGQYSDEVVERWLNVFLRRFFISQFKRSCSPDAPKVGTISLSPRGDWSMPSDADFYEWLK